MSDEVEEFLEHFGVRGMKWGQRKTKAPKTVQRHFLGPNTAIRKDAPTRAEGKAFKRELKNIQKKNSAAYKVASKDPTFKREVKAQIKGQKTGRTGLTRNVTKAEMTKGEVFTGRVSGTFKNSKGQKVSEDFANAVLAKAGKTALNRQRNRAIAVAVISTGAAFLAAKGLKNVDKLMDSHASRVGAKMAEGLFKRP